MKFLNLFSITIFTISSSLFGSVTFNFNFDESFDKQGTPEVVELIKKEMQVAGACLGSYLNHNASVNIDVILTDLMGTGLAGGALVQLHNSDVLDVTPGFYGTVVADKILYGIDRNGAETDGLLLFGFDDLSKYIRIGADEEDRQEGLDELRKVVIHELIHTLGFWSALDRTPDFFTYEGKGVFSAYDYYIVDKNNIPLWTYKTHNDSGVTEAGYFSGPNTKAALFNINLPLPMNQESDKADYIHSCGDDNLSFILIGNMMNPSAYFSNEDEPLCLSAIEAAMLEDIGFSINKEKAICKKSIHTLLDKCINSATIKDSTNIRSIFEAFIKSIPESQRDFLDLESILNESDEKLTVNVEAS